jgi:hypothetical protein
LAEIGTLMAVTGPKQAERHARSAIGWVKAVISA